MTGIVVFFIVSFIVFQSAEKALQETKRAELLKELHCIFEKQISLDDARRKLIEEIGEISDSNNTSDERIAEIGGKIKEFKKNWVKDD